MTDVVVSHLMMDAPEGLVAGRHVPANVSLHQESAANKARVAAACYRAVGGPWHWVDRRDWDDTAWQTAVSGPDIEVWTAHEQGELAGYFQLRHQEGVVEIQYFGLLPERMGRGIGGWLLTRAVERAWSLGPQRVILETCSLDGPAALPNYLARGFHVVRQETRQRPLAT